jgi:hypothetical protein
MQCHNLPFSGCILQIFARHQFHLYKRFDIASYICKNWLPKVEIPTISIIFKNITNILKVTLELIAVVQELKMAKMYAPHI